MSRSAAEDSGFNLFHSLAALGQSKLALKTISTSPKKFVTAALAARDKKGRTPLHLAAYYGHLKVLKIFLEASPEASEIRDSDGNNVRDSLRRPDVPVIGNPESQRCFRRMMKIGKKDYQYEDFGLGPMDVWDLSVSGNATVAVVKPSWGGGNSRTLLSSLKGVQRQFDLGGSNVPRYVATSHSHSLVVTADRCYAWGKNVNGVLGLDTEERIVMEPRALDMIFAKAVGSDSVNAFSALEGCGKPGELVKDPLIGVDCCDFYSLCYSTTKVWSWGANRGQMVNRAPSDSIVEKPTLVYQSNIRIRSVRCCDNAIVILLSSGQILLLTRDKVSRLQSGGRNAQDIDSMAASGSSVIVLTHHGKLLRYSLKFLLEDKDDVQTLWTPRRSKDDILSFDVGDSGNVILSTKSGVFRIEEDKEIKEFKGLRGMALTSVKTDAQFRSFVGVNNIVAGLACNDLRSLIKLGHGGIVDHTQWGSKEYSMSSNSGDFVLNCDGENLLVHRSLLFARCPTLRPLIVGASSKEKNVIATPGGSTTFRQNNENTDSLLVESSHLESVRAFVNALYFSRDAPQPDQRANMSVGPILHEFNALMRLCTKDPGMGMWDAMLSGISCDVELDGPRVAHSAILASASPVLAVQLSRWSDGKMQDPVLNEATIDDVLRHAYTGEIVVSAAPASEYENAQKLLDIWQAADELLMAKLREDCEGKLFQMLNLDLVIPFLHATMSHKTRLFHSLLDIVVRNMPFFMTLIDDFETDLLDTIEKLHKGLAGTEPADKSLADAFETLKRQNSSSDAPKLYRLPKPVNSDYSKSTTNVTPGFESQSCSEVPGQSQLQPKASRTVITTPTSSPLSANSGQREGGWIPSRRKSRNSSTHSAETRTETVKALTATTGKCHANSTPPSSFRLTSNGLNRNTSAHASSSPEPLSSSQRIAPSMTSPPQHGQVTRLGNSLPKLGSAPRTNQSGKTPRPKLSLKGNKSILQFKNPAQFAETLGREIDLGSSTVGTPWKQPAEVVQTSQVVIEKLENAHQANSRRVTGGNVWKI